MLKYFTLCCILFSAVRSTITAQVTPVPGKTYAVVIGISTYKSKALPALKYSDKDATLFASWLKSKAGGNVPGKQIKLLLNEQATIAAVYDALDWLKENCRKQDIGYIYFSGHGDVETKNAFSLGYLLAYNTPPNNYRNNAIRIEDLNNKANTLSIKNRAKIILITDACHSGKLAGDFYKGKQLVASQLRLVLNNEVRLTSCATNEEAAEGPDWGGGRGVFSYYLLMGLNGLADLKKDGTVQLQELTKFLDSSFAADKYLLLGKHQQHPVTDGNPNFPLALTDTATLAQLHASQVTTDSANSSLSIGLQSLKAIGLQPIDYFFSLSRAQPLEDYLDFNSYDGVAVRALPLKILDDRIQYQQAVEKIVDSLARAGQDYTGNDLANLDSLKLLRNQLLKSKSIIDRFNEQFLELVHDKGQDMINAYLAGDLAELEKRQYYYSGNRQYRYFLSMLKVAIRIAPVNHSLAGLLKINYSYLSGLVDRLEIATTDNPAKLLNNAFINLRAALQSEPYAAYIHNELGNLYLGKKNFDSASYHYNLATVLSPTWSIPWSNKIRLNLALNKPVQAKEAIHKADSLQPNLAYVMMNAGLVMERESNWLAAESFYIKAISLNKIHFLPYERLGKIYLLTGEYAKADSFLFDAQIRKKDFAVNARYFEFGVELGGAPKFSNWRSKPVCDWEPSDSANTKSAPYSMFLRAMQSMDKGSISNDTVSFQLNKVLEHLPRNHLAYHYLGKHFYQQGKIEPAAAAILQAISNYESMPGFYTRLEKELYSGHPDPNACLLQSLMFYQYDYLEDHYLLGTLYEKQGLTDKALVQYNLVSTIENRRQMDQANIEGFPVEKVDSPNKSGTWIDEVLLEQYERPMNMGGVIKAARLYDRLGDYLQEEKVLLNQVLLNRVAGDKRQAAFDAGKPGTRQLAGGTKINFYWLSINRNMESETYNFYRRMVSLFPRDFEWKQKAGLFLYHRLALTYNQMQVDEYLPFYKSITSFAYPWLSGEEPPNEEDIVIDIPGTGEKVTIEMPLYEPLKESLGYLQQSVFLSGDYKARPEVLRAMADLNSWAGNNELAIAQYKELANLQPANDTIRDRLITMLIGSFEFPAAANELEVAFRRNQLKQQQIPLLAEYQIKTGKFDEAKALLKKFQPRNDPEKDKRMSLYAKMYLLSGQPGMALPYLVDSLPVMKIEEEDDLVDFDININKKNANDFRLYSIARIYAQENANDKALAALKQALDAGFNGKYVLDNDPAWAKLRNSGKWIALIKKYDFKVDYAGQPLKTPRDINQYRIPNYHSRYN
ncbi:MAG: hypothetical protein ABIQ31_19405 [Ferruginibacter sp.]